VLDQVWPAAAGAGARDQLWRLASCFFTIQHIQHSMATLHQVYHSCPVLQTRQRQQQQQRQQGQQRVPVSPRAPLAAVAPRRRCRQGYSRQSRPYSSRHDWTCSHPLGSTSSLCRASCPATRQHNCGRNTMSGERCRGHCGSSRWPLLACGRCGASVPRGRGSSQGTGPSCRGPAACSGQHSKAAVR